MTKARLILVFLLIFNSFAFLTTQALATEVGRELKVYKIIGEAYISNLDGHTLATLLPGMYIKGELQDDNTISVQWAKDQALLEGEYEEVELLLEEGRFIEDDQLLNIEYEFDFILSKGTQILNDDLTPALTINEDVIYPIMSENDSYLEIILGNNIYLIEKFEAPNEEMVDAEQQLSDSLNDIENSIENNVENDIEVSTDIETAPIVNEELTALNSFDNFFNVSKQNVGIYTNKNGSLQLVGYLIEGQDYLIDSDYGNWHKIKFNNGYAFVLKGDTNPSNGSSIQNKSKGSSSLGRLKVNNDVFVYDNTSGSLISFASLIAGTEYAFIRQMGDWYEIDVAGRTGFVHNSSVTRVFSDTDRYFTVINDDVGVFINKNGSLIRIGSLVKGEEYYRESSNGNWHEIRFGEGLSFVHNGSTEPSNGQSLRNMYQKFVNKGTFLTLSELTVYDNSSGSLVPFAQIPKDIKIPIFKVEGNWLQVGIAGRIGYVYRPSVKIINLDIVNPRANYTYEQLEKDFQLLKTVYPDIIQTEVIGRSVDGRNIYALKLGTGKAEIFINGSHHAREHMTTNLIMDMIDQYAKSYASGTNFNGYNTKQILDKTSIWFVPMVNPDGVTLVQKGHTSAKNPSNVLALNNGSTDFSSWKANIRGVDLNRQYPAGWADIRANAGQPGPMNFKGYQPLSEPEVVALYNFTKAKYFRIAVAYHSAGEILYWNYKQASNVYNRDFELASKIRSITGYSLFAPQSNPSGGGYTDWFIQEMKKPGFTPEISLYTAGKPVPIGNYDRIWSQNKTIGLMLAEEALKLGPALEGWIKQNSKWYFYDSSGIMQKGWRLIENKWYYFHTDGVMKTGWFKQNSKWYYLQFDGSMVTGWVKDNSKWYFLDSGGVMKSGWVQVNQQWYYLYDNGSMASNTTIQGFYLGFDGIWVE